MICDLCNTKITCTYDEETVYKFTCHCCEKRKSEKTDHACCITNELGQDLLIIGRAWIYDSLGDFIGDFEVNYCPICGLKLKDFVPDGQVGVPKLPA